MTLHLKVAYVNLYSETAKADSGSVWQGWRLQVLPPGGT